MISRFISLILIVALTFQCLIKLGLIGYYSLNITYIIKELCENRNRPETECHGKCFLKKNMANADKNEKKAAEIFKQIEFPVFLPGSSLPVIFEPHPAADPPAGLPDLYSYHTSYKIFHPPLAV